jgi:hypothetical protein
MTELFIDRQPVVLPKDFPFDIIAGNPFFTKNGAYTLELALSLPNPENAKIYRHYSRTNSRLEIAASRTAILIADSDVLLDGTEIISEVTDTEVKIQPVSGESELNYLIGGDKKPNSLGPGFYFAVSPESSRDVFIPVFSLNEEEIYNEYRIVKISGNPAVTANRTNPPVQSELSYLIGKIINAPGYGIRDSVFDSSFLQYIRVLNGRKTVKYSEDAAGLDGTTTA